MATSYGKILRKIRIDKDELLKDMAENLCMTSSYLSSIENGKRPIPTDLTNKIISCYGLSQDIVMELQSAEDSVRTNIDIDLSQVNHNQKTMVLTLARQFEKLTDEQLEEIRCILEK